MCDVLEYYVMRNEDNVTMWLSDDEKTWTKDFGSAAAFLDPHIADNIAKRNLNPGQTFYVICCMSSELDDD